MPWPNAVAFRSVGRPTHRMNRSSARLAGYDYVMSIEHEDALASVDEGLRAAVDTLAGAAHGAAG
jgi:hypothetical protein